MKNSSDHKWSAKRNEWQRSGVWRSSVLTAARIDQVCSVITSLFFSFFLLRIWMLFVCRFDTISFLSLFSFFFLFPVFLVFISTLSTPQLNSTLSLCTLYMPIWYGSNKNKDNDQSCFILCFLLFFWPSLAKQNRAKENKKANKQSNANQSAKK